MANTVLLKKSSVTAKVPLTTDLVYGEVALNYTDGKLYFKDSTNAIQFLGSSSATETLSNKTLTSPVISGGTINNAVIGGTTPAAITGSSVTSTGNLVSSYSVGDEGGEILLTKPQTNTSIAGAGVRIDIYQNKLRIWEDGGSNRGAYIDLTAAANTVGTNLIAAAGGGTVTSITAGTGLTGGTISTSGTIAIDSTVVTTSGTQNVSNKTITGSDITVLDVLFTLSDNDDTTRKGRFSLNASQTTNTTASFTLPSATTTLGGLGTNQSWTGNNTFDGNVTGSAGFQMGSAAVSQTFRLGYGATSSGNTKLLDLGTGGLAGSTTTIAIGSTNGTTVTANGTWNYLDTGFTIQDDGDVTKQIRFAVNSGQTTGTTRTFTLPTTTTTLAGLGVAQTWTATNTFQGTVTLNDPVDGATNNFQVGTAVTNTTYKLGFGSTSSGNTKTVELGTGGASGSTTTIAIGSVNGTTVTANGAWTFANDAVFTGNLTVNGTTTTINSTTISVDDKNIELGSVASPTDVTADGGGITLKGATDKTIIWGATNGWTSSEDINVASGKIYRINGTSVLSSTTLGSGVTGSSLTSVGTITTGTWSGSFGAVSGANLTSLTAGNLSGTIPSGVLGNSTVYIGTTAVALNRATANLALTGITSIDGTAAGLSATLVATSGGTGQSTYAIGDLLQGGATNTLTKLAAVATGNVLLSGGVTTASAWGKVGLTTHVSGTLPIANGGTNLTTYTTGDIVYASASNTLASLADVATGNALISGGVGVAPSYGKIGLTTHVSGTLPVANGGTGTATALTAGSVVFAGASGVYSQDNAQLFWDDTNNRLGIGTTGPLASLDVANKFRVSPSAVATQEILAGTQVDSYNANFSLLPSPATPGTSTIQICAYSPTVGWKSMIETSNKASGSPDVILAKTGGNVGVGTATPGYKLEVNGAFAATTKSFVIPHPTKPDMKLRYGSLEGPENGVYVRGRLTGDTIELPDYWVGLVHEDSITVSLTPIGNHQKLYVKDIVDNTIVVGNENLFGKTDCFYTVFAERKDVDKLEVEI